MDRDDGFITRCVLWNALWNLIPQPLENQAAELIADLEQHYGFVIARGKRDRLALAADLQDANDRNAKLHTELGLVTVLAEKPLSRH